MTRSLVGLGRIFVVLLIAGLAGCASPEEKAQSYYEKGAKLLEKGDYVAAQLEFRNALQINEDMAAAWMGIAKVHQQQQSWRPAYGTLKRVIELDPANAEALEDLARIMLFSGDLDEAMKYNNQAFKLAPESVPVLTLRSAILLKLGDREGALLHVRKALELDPSNAEALLVQAAERLEEEDSAGALAIVDQGLEANPKNAGLLVFKIRILEMDKDQEGAREILAKLAEYYPEETAYRAALVNHYVSIEDFDAAEKELRAIAAQSPDNMEAQLDIARFLNSARGFDAARQELLELSKNSKEPIRFEMALAELQFQRGERAAAELRLKELIEKYAGTDDGEAARVRLAQMFLLQERIKETQALVDEVLKDDKDNVQALAIRAELAVRAGKFEAAINDLRAALNQQGLSPELKIQLGRALELNGSIDLADDSFAVAMRESNFRSDVGLEYVRFLQRQGKADRAEEIITELMTRNRADEKVLTELAGIKLRKQEWESAEKVAEAIKGINEDSGIASDIMGVALSGQNRFEESIEILSSAYAKTPEDAGRMYGLVRTYIQSGKREEAETFLNSVLEANPDNTQALVLLGSVALTDAGGEAEAEAYFKKAIEKAPDEPIGYRALANFYAAQDRRSDAQKVVVEGIKANPDDVSLGLILASYLEIDGKFEEAISEYERLYALQPQAQLIANNLASLLADHRDDEESLNRAFELASRLKSSEIAYFKDTLAWTHFRRGDTAVALGLLEEAVKELPNLLIVRYHLAQVYMKEGRTESARRELNKVVELDKSGSFKAEVESALGKLDNAK